MSSSPRNRYHSSHIGVGIVLGLGLTSDKLASHLKAAGIDSSLSRLAQGPLCWTLQAEDWSLLRLWTV